MSSPDPNEAVYRQGSDDYREPKEMFKRVVELLRARAGANPASLVDVGCASGAFLHYARRSLKLQDSLGLDIRADLLEQARRFVPESRFLVHSIEQAPNPTGGSFDFCTCLGTLSLFEELGPILRHLLSFVRKGGSLIVADLINDDPIDVLARFRRVPDADEESGPWRSEFNVRSVRTYERLLRKLHPQIALEWGDFRLPFPIAKSDPLRAWTMKTEQNPYQLVVGTGQLLNFKILTATLP